MSEKLWNHNELSFEEISRDSRKFSAVNFLIKLGRYTCLQAFKSLHAVDIWIFSFPSFLGCAKYILETWNCRNANFMGITYPEFRSTKLLPFSWYLNVVNSWRNSYHRENSTKNCTNFSIQFDLGRLRLWTTEDYVFTNIPISSLCTDFYVLTNGIRKVEKLF